MRPLDASAFAKLSIFKISKLLRDEPEFTADVCVWDCCVRSGVFRIAAQVIQAVVHHPPIVLPREDVYVDDATQFRLAAVGLLR